MPRYKFINTYIDIASEDAVIKNVMESIEEKKKKRIVFLNAYKIYLINKNKYLAEAIGGADLILADGVPIVWACKLLGFSKPSRVNGTDLFERLLGIAEAENKKIFLLGATQENLELLINKLKKKHPALQIAGARNGYFTEENDDEVIKQINSSNADILFLGFGSPGKELWSHKYKEKINVPVIQGVGGSFDVLSGLILRAPVFMQEHGLEWLYRVFKEPRRMFKRYLISNSVFLYLFFISFIKGKFNT